MTAMNLSKEDGNRDFYDEFFKKAAFVRKENEELRYIPEKHDDPKPDVENETKCEVDNYGNEYGTGCDDK